MNGQDPSGVMGGGGSPVPFLDPATFQGILRLAEKNLYFTRVTRNEHVAAYSLFVYDWLICWETERGLMTSPGLSPAKLAYLFCRYWPMLTHPITIWMQVVITDRTLCRKVYQIPLYLTILNFAGAASVLAVRLYAFTGARRWTLLILGACCAAAAGFQAWVVATHIALVPEVPACFPVDRSTSDKARSQYFLSALLFDVVATALFIFHVIRIKFRISESSPTVKLLVREGAMYFAAIAAVNIVSAVMTFQKREELSGTVAPFSMLLPNIFACRLVINLRAAVPDSNATMRTGHSFGTGFGFRNPHPPHFSFNGNTAAGDEEMTLMSIGTVKSKVPSKQTSDELGTEAGGRELHQAFENKSSNGGEVITWLGNYVSERGATPLPPVPPRTPPASQ